MWLRMVMSVQVIALIRLRYMIRPVAKQMKIERKRRDDTLPLVNL